VRNGHVLNACVSSYDLCVLYEDGSMQMIPGGKLHSQAAVEAFLQNAWQAWSFGPILLNPDGSPVHDFSGLGNEYLTRVHPRTAIGYFGPGHYAIVSAFGYRDDLPGVTLEELSAYFAFLGCRQAYNLDGGGSTHLWFHGSERGWPSEACELSDFIYIEDRSREGTL
jgi:exopolysaccharide biosynthesis protein